MSDERLVGSTDPVASKPKFTKFGFVKKEDGNMLVFGLCIFVVMLASSGMAIDFMRHENHRTQLQSTLDRAVLAAADLDQKNDPTAVVNDYFAKANLDNITLNVNVDEGTIHRNVHATAKTPVRSMFLNMLGINNIDAPAEGAAEERVNNVEISLVLDVSGSMGRTANEGGLPKIAYLREAGQNFIDSLLRPSTTGRVSVSMVPYTGQTNAGANLMEYYNIDRVHDHSSCIEFEDSDFTQAKIPFGAELEQVQHFGWGSGADTPINQPMCSDEPQDEIVAFQNSSADLNARIAAFEPRTNTAIHTAMKWAVEMLQPEFNTVVQGMVGDGLIPAAFANRPVAFDDPETTKIIVLMTDGENVDQLRLPEHAYDTAEEREHWANNPFWYRGLDGNYVNLVEIQDARYDKPSRDSADSNLHAICNVAREQGILVFTIGFELGYSEHARNVLSACASSDAHAYEAEAIDLDATFSAVARTITQLRLTQ